MTSPAPPLAVVIPSGRGGGFLREAVRSVLDQSFTDFELVVVADGWDAGLADIEAMDRRVRAIGQVRRGVSVARNVGICATRGELVAFLDDDDRMLPGRLAAQVEVMRDRLDVGLCHTQYRLIDTDGVPGALGHASDVQYLDLLRGEVHVLLPTVVVRRSLLEEVGTFDSTLGTGEDLDLIYRVAQESGLAFLPEVLSEYRRHGGNASDDAVQGARDLNTLLVKHLRRAAQRECIDEVVAARTGIEWASRYGAAATVVHARAAWRRRDLRSLGRNVTAGLRLSPGEIVRDLVGNRFLTPAKQDWSVDAIDSTVFP